MFTYFRTPSQDHLHREKLSVTFRDKIYTAWPKNGRPWLDKRVLQSYSSSSWSILNRPSCKHSLYRQTTLHSPRPTQLQVSVWVSRWKVKIQCVTAIQPRIIHSSPTLGDTRGLSRVLLIMHVTVIDNWSGLYFSPLWWLKATWLIWIHRIHTELQANRTRAGSAVSIS